jgi:hypothetical protein
MNTSNVCPSKTPLESLFTGHPADRCPFQAIAKPLAYAIFIDAQLAQILVQSSLRRHVPINTFDNTYAQWLCVASEKGFLNLFCAFLIVIKFRGYPQLST